jgi:dipeptidyl aminopeptidase/acylaminoacyl peptidase
MTEFENITTDEQTEALQPMAIEEMRKHRLTASPIVIEETLADGANFERYIASYTSEGNKIYGLFTVPKAAAPEGGYPAIVFIHGHLDPKLYTPTARYVAYQNGFASAGYVTFKPDLRGHGKSEGQAVQSNFSPDYVYDALNLVAALQADERINPAKIGMWGHSMGGGITLRSMVVSTEIKAGIMWAGVVGDWEDLLERYRRRTPWVSTSASSSTRSRIMEFTQKYGSPSANPKFWGQIDAYNYLADISGPVQLHHGTADESVPVEFSRHLKTALEKTGKTVEYYEYPGADHNLSGAAFSAAMRRSVEFFDKYLR